MKRLVGSRGATGAEYALVMVLVVVTSIGAINFLTDRASDETRNQADCVAERPPVDDCQIPPLVPTTSTTIASPPAPPGPPGPPAPPGPPPGPCDLDDPPAVCYEPPAPPPAPPPPPPHVVSDFPAPNSAINPGNGDWEITPSITIVDANNVPVAGVRVIFAIQVYNPSPPPPFLPTIFAECVTDVAGTCTVTTAIPYANANLVKVSVYQIVSSPPTTPPGIEWDNIAKP